MQTVHTILNNSTNEININFNTETGEKNINKKKYDKTIPLNIYNSFLNFSQLCIEHFEFSDISKIVQKNINDFENDNHKNEKIKKKKDKNKILKLDLNDTTENRIKNINNLIINKPIKKKKITDLLEIKTVKKCKTFPIQIKK